MHRILLTYLGEKLNLPATGLKEDEVLEHLSQHNAQNALVEEVREIFHTCNFARFATGTGAFLQMDQILVKARTLVNRMEENGGKNS